MDSSSNNKIDESQAKDLTNKPAEHYSFPTFNLLTDVNNNINVDDIKETSTTIQKALYSFGINIKVSEVMVGPIATIFAIELLDAKTRIAMIKSLKDDIALAIGQEVINIDRIPGKSLIGIEVRNNEREKISFKYLLKSNEFQNANNYTVILGKDYYGNSRLLDLSKTSHMLVSGTTGSGKSMFIHSLINSLLFKCSPNQVSFLFIDTKAVELTVYSRLPHSLTETITDFQQALVALSWVVSEMEHRYQLFSELNVRNIEEYNQKIKNQSDSGSDIIPRLVIVIDELADLMMNSANSVEEFIIRLAQKSRAAGIHLILVTQRPSVKIVTGIIKANLPNRISFKAASSIDSVTILDRAGAEELLAYGDYIYKSSDEIFSDRIECPYIPQEDVQKIVDYISTNNDFERYKLDIFDNKAIEEEENHSNNYDPYLHDAAELVINYGMASASLIQRTFKVGYARAGRIIDELEEIGIISSYQGSAPRNVLITKEEWYDIEVKLFGEQYEYKKYLKAYDDTSADIESEEPEKPETTKQKVIRILRKIDDFFNSK